MAAIIASAAIQIAICSGKLMQYRVSNSHFGIHFKGQRNELRFMKPRPEAH